MWLSGRPEVAWNEGPHVHGLEEYVKQQLKLGI